MRIIILMINGIVWYRAEIVILILIVDRTSGTPGGRRKKRRRRCAAPWCHDLKRRPVISMNESQE